MPRSLYAVHLQFTSLGERPFEPPANLRPDVASLLKDPRCLSKAPTSAAQGELLFKLGALGNVHFGLRKRLLGRKNSLQATPVPPPRLRQRLEARFGSREPHWLDAEITDERLYPLYFELAESIPVSAQRDGQTVCRGQIFIHLYPSGHVALLVALSLVDSRYLEDSHTLGQAAEEMRPWQKSGGWAWTGAGVQGSMAHVVATVKARLLDGLFDGVPTAVRDGEWFAAFRVGEALGAEACVSALRLRDSKVLEPTYQRPFASHERLIVGRRGFAWLTAAARGQRAGQRFFHRMLRQSEFAALKEQAYRDYLTYLSGEVEDLQANRLDPFKNTVRDAVATEPYDARAVRHIKVLEGPLLDTKPFMRWLRRQMEERNGVPGLYQQLSLEVDAWKTELQARALRNKARWKSLFGLFRKVAGT